MQHRRENKSFVAPNNRGQLYLGNLDPSTTYVEGMHRILQADAPDDFVLANRRDPLGARISRTGVRRKAEKGRAIEWRGKGVDETGVDKKSGKKVVRIDPVYFRQPKSIF